MAMRGYCKERAMSVSIYKFMKSNVKKIITEV